MFSPAEAKHGTAVGEVMETVGDARLIRPYASNLNSHRSVGRTSVGERWSNEGYNVISSRKDEVSNQTFIAVDNEVAAKFFGLFMVFDKVGGRHGTKVAAYRLINSR